MKGGAADVAARLFGGKSPWPPEDDLAKAALGWVEKASPRLQPPE